MREAPRVPAAGRLLLRLGRLGERRAEWEADLDELFVARASAFGIRYARRRYVLDAVSLVVRSPWRMSMPTRVRRRSDHRMNLKLAFRSLRKTPFVTAVAILSLTLGVGANTAIFSIFHEMLVRLLPVADPDRLVNLSAPGPKPGRNSCNLAGDCDTVFSYPMFRDLEARETRLLHLAAHRSFGAGIAIRGQSIGGEAMLVSGNYFSVLGLRPALGRLIAPADDQVPGASPVVVLSHRFWENQFGADPSLIGEPIEVNGRIFRVVGVAPDTFEGTTLGIRPMLFAPLTMRAQVEPTFSGFENRRSYWLYVFGRLAPGATLERARSALNPIYRAILHDVEAPLQVGMSDAAMARFRARELGVEAGARGQSSVGREEGRALTLLLGVTGFVLLIACANIANLLLARASTRSGEMAIRLSIGASRRSLVAQLLTESLLLAGAGGIGGLAVGSGLLKVMAATMPESAAGHFPTGLDFRVIIFTSVVAVATGVLAGLYPAIHSSRPDLLSMLKNQSGQPAGARAAKRFRLALATMQIALAMTLLGASGLFIRSLFNISAIDLGMHVENVVTFRIAPRLGGYSPAEARAFYERLEEELSAAPGVAAVTAAMVPLLAGNNYGTDVSVQGFDAGPDADRDAFYNVVGAGYFRAMGVPVLAGREFTTADRNGTRKVAIVSRRFAEKFGLGTEAVGRLMGTSGQLPGRKLDLEIVGLVEDAKYSEVKGAMPPLYFLPYRQDERPDDMAFYVRAAGSPRTLMDSIRPIVARLDPNLPVVGLSTFVDVARENVFSDRLIALLSASFAGLATLLAGIGLYGMLAYAVSQRTREFGLRLALGAHPLRVLRLVLGQIAIVTAVGITCGLLAAAGVGTLAQSLLYELDGRDPFVMAGAAALLAVVALVSALVPAYRASRIDPMRALRYE